MTPSGHKVFLFDKVLTPSDVGKLNRLVLPKQQAERHFPFDTVSPDAPQWQTLPFKDEKGRQWRFRYYYWSSSQSYVLTKGWAKYVEEKMLCPGDLVCFHRVKDGTHFLTCRRQVDGSLPAPANTLDLAMLNTARRSATEALLEQPPSKKPRTKVGESKGPPCVHGPKKVGRADGPQAKAAASGRSSGTVAVRARQKGAVDAKRKLAAKLGGKDRKARGVKGTRWKSMAKQKHKSCSASTGKLVSQRGVECRTMESEKQLLQNGEVISRAAHGSRIVSVADYGMEEKKPLARLAGKVKYEAGEQDEGPAGLYKGRGGSRGAIGNGLSCERGGLVRASNTWNTSSSEAEEVVERDRSSARAPEAERGLKRMKLEGLLIAGKGRAGSGGEVKACGTNESRCNSGGGGKGRGGKEAEGVPVCEAKAMVMGRSRGKLTSTDSDGDWSGSEQVDESCFEGMREQGAELGTGPDSGRDEEVEDREEESVERSKLEGLWMAHEEKQSCGLSSPSPRGPLDWGAVDEQWDVSAERRGRTMLLSSAQFSAPGWDGGSTTTDTGTLDSDMVWELDDLLGTSMEVTWDALHNARTAMKEHQVEVDRHQQKLGVLQAKAKSEPGRPLPTVEEQPVALDAALKEADEQVQVASAIAAVVEAGHAVLDILTANVKPQLTHPGSLEDLDAWQHPLVTTPADHSKSLPSPVTHPKGPQPAPTAEPQSVDALLAIALPTEAIAHVVDQNLWQSSCKGTPSGSSHSHGSEATVLCGPSVALASSTAMELAGRWGVERSLTGDINLDLCEVGAGDEGPRRVLAIGGKDHDAGYEMVLAGEMHSRTKMEMEGVVVPKSQGSDMEEERGQKEKALAEACWEVGREGRGGEDEVKDLKGGGEGHTEENHPREPSTLVSTDHPTGVAGLDEHGEFHSPSWARGQASTRMAVGGSGLAPYEDSHLTVDEARREKVQVASRWNNSGELLLEELGALFGGNVAGGLGLLHDTVGGTAAPPPGGWSSVMGDQVLSAAWLRGSGPLGGEGLAGVQSQMDSWSGSERTVEDDPEGLGGPLGLAVHMDLQCNCDHSFSSPQASSFIDQGRAREGNEYHGILPPPAPQPQTQQPQLQAHGQHLPLGQSSSQQPSPVGQQLQPLAAMAVAAIAGGAVPSLPQPDGGKIVCFVEGLLSSFVVDLLCIHSALELREGLIQATGCSTVLYRDRGSGVHFLNGAEDWSELVRMITVLFVCK